MSNCKVTLFWDQDQKMLGTIFKLRLEQKVKNVDIKQKIFLLCHIVILFWDQDHVERRNHFQVLKKVRAKS